MNKKTNQTKLLVQICYKYNLVNISEYKNCSMKRFKTNLWVELSDPW